MGKGIYEVDLQNRVVAWTSAADDVESRNAEYEDPANVIVPPLRDAMGGYRYRREGMVLRLSTAAELAGDVGSVPRCFSFARVVHRNLSGADAATKFSRGLELRSKAPAVVGVFVLDLRLAGDRATAGALAAVRSSWAALKADPIMGVAGSDPAHLLTAEADRVEADAASNFGFTLV